MHVHQWLQWDLNENLRVEPVEEDSIAIDPTATVISELREY
jgi:hypothetical protein